MEDAIPPDQIERIQPTVRAVVASILRLSLSLPDDAPSAADYSPPEE
ncbi:MAG TPA: hypothetical protein VKG25_16005 [Bryobacteraceae bacterium]|nr:hypothetical protein [Bryobacteraceae bacterium]